MARILLPTPLRPDAGGAATVDVEAATVGAAIEALVLRHPGLRRHLYDDEGKIRSFVNLYRNDEDVRYLAKDETLLAADDSLSIVPSIAGGASHRGTVTGAAKTGAPRRNTRIAARNCGNLLIAIDWLPSV